MIGLAAPLALLGLLAIALPIIAHLLRRRDVPVRRIATLALLRKADVASRRRVRIVDRTLLAARIALVAIAALALGAPYVTSALAWGDGRLTSVSIVIDDSMSMSRSDGESTLLDRAVDRAREVIGALPEGSEVAIVLAGTPPRVLAARSEDRGIGRDRLARIAPGSARGTSLGAGIELAARQLAGARHPRRRVVVITDHALHADAGDLEVPRGVEVEIERIGDTGGERSGNLAITDAIATPDPTLPGSIAIAIEVRAFADERTHAAVVARRAGAEIARGEVALAEGAGRTILRVDAPEGSAPAAEVALVLEPPDALAIDDARGVLLRPVSAPRVVIVDGDPLPLGRRRQATGDEARFLSQALSLAPRSAGGASGGFVHRTVDPGAFLGARLDDADVLVLANVDLRDASLRARVEQHVARGGGLLVTAGDQVEASGWARLESILPARMISTIDTETVGIERGPSALLEGGASGLEAVRTTRRLALEPEPGAEIALAWRDGAPALVIARGRRVAVLGTTVDDAWSDLPLRPGFLPLVVRLANALAPPGAMPDAPFAPGAIPPLRAPDGATELALIAPDGRVIEIERAALARPIDLSVAIEPGAWQVRVATAESGLRDAPRSAFVVAPPLSESDLRVIASDEDDAAGAAGAAAAGGSRTHEQTLIRRSIAPWLFALIGLLAVIEGALRVARPRSA